MVRKPTASSDKATSSSPKTPAKRATTRKAAATSAVKAAPKPVVVSAAPAGDSEKTLKKKELIEIVTERSGVKKRDAKPVVEAMLAVLGQALAEGRELNLQPLGKVKINRRKDLQNGTVLIAKVRQSEKSTEPKDSISKAAE